MRRIDYSILRRFLIIPLPPADPPNSPRVPPPSLHRPKQGKSVVVNPRNAPALVTLKMIIVIVEAIIWMVYFGQIGKSRVDHSQLLMPTSSEALFRFLRQYINSASASGFVRQDSEWSDLREELAIVPLIRANTADHILLPLRKIKTGPLITVVNVLRSGQ